MKYFAITPDPLRPDQLIRHLPKLTELGVRHLYIRANHLGTACRDLLKICIDSGIMPFIHASQWRTEYPSGTGIHFKSTHALQPAFCQKQCRTASAHSIGKAAALLNGGADYAYLSPVFSPLSKPHDRRCCLVLDEIDRLCSMYGERVILLGGMTHERIAQLKQRISHDFSIGGVSLYFSHMEGSSAMTTNRLPTF